MEKLYHYTSYPSLLKILETKSLRFGLLEKTNDPKEYLDHSLVFSGNGYMEHCELYTYWISEEIKKYKLLCFTYDDVIEGFAHPRMWAQYASNNEGCCLVLNKEKIDIAINNLKSEKNYFSINKKILYENQIPEIEYFVEKDIEEFVKSNIEYFLFTKFIDWQNEHEYRYVIYENRTEMQKDILLSIEDAIEGVYFGHKFPQILKEKVMELFSNRDIFFSNITWKNGICTESVRYKSYKDYLIHRVRDNFIGKLLQLNNDPTRTLSANHSILIQTLLSMNCINKDQYNNILEYDNKIFNNLLSESNENLYQLLNETNFYLLSLIKENQEI